MTTRRFQYGYAMIDGKIEICENEAEVIRWIFHKRIERTSGYAIAKALHDSGINYFSDSSRKSACKVSKILYDARYFGDSQYPAIVDKGIFLAVQEMKGEPYCKKSPAFSTEKEYHTADFDYLPSDEINRQEQVLMNDNEVDKTAIFALAAAKYNCIIERSTP